MRSFAIRWVPFFAHNDERFTAFVCTYDAEPGVQKVRLHSREVEIFPLVVCISLAGARRRPVNDHETTARSNNTGDFVQGRIEPVMVRSNRETAIQVVIRQREVPEVGNEGNDVFRESVFSVHLVEVLSDVNSEGGPHDRGHLTRE